MGKEQEPQNELKITETVTRSGRVRIMDDDAWQVGWQQPDGQTVWHRHEDAFRVIRQTERVIQKFLGVPVDEGLDPEEQIFGYLPRITLLDIKDALLVFGEVQKAQDLANRVTHLVTLSNSPATPRGKIIWELERLADEIGPHVRSRLKVLAYGKLQEAAATTDAMEGQQTAIEATITLLERGREGMSIAKSLFYRLGAILAWVDLQEQKVGFLESDVAIVLRDIKNDQEGKEHVQPYIRQFWHTLFFGQEGHLAPVLAIRGNPYANIVRKREVTSLRRLGDLLLDGELTTVKKILDAAYPELKRVMDDREAREASGRYDRYRRKKIRI